MPQKFVSDAVIKQICKLPNYTSLKILDLSCGEGYIISKLAERGCEVTGTHYREGDYIIQNKELLPKLNIVNGVDLHQPLHFEDESFDLVLMTEVLEHLESHVLIVSEVARVLKKGGYFIFTTPNIYRLHSRIKFLLTGHHKLIQRKLSWDLDRSDLYANHINMVNFPLINVVLFQGKMHVKKMFITRFKWKHFYSILLFPFNYLFNLTIKKYENETRNKGQEDIAKWMRSFPMSMSEQMACLAQKD